MVGFFKNLFASKPEQPEPVVDYKGFQITPCPKNNEGGWSTEADISKIIDDETRTHHFIRADKLSSREGAIDLTLNKCRQTIDQIGEQIFR